MPIVVTRNLKILTSNKARFDAAVIADDNKADACDKQCYCDK